MTTALWTIFILFMLVALPTIVISVIWFKVFAKRLDVEDKNE